MAGENHGSKKFIAIETTPGAGTYVQIGGEISSTLSGTMAPVEITNKSLGDVQTFLDGEGLLGATLSGEYKLNSDSAFDALDGLMQAKTMQKYLYGDGTNGIVFDALVTAFSQTSAQGDSGNASVSWQISGARAVV